MNQRFLDEKFQRCQKYPKGECFNLRSNLDRVVAVAGDALGQWQRLDGWARGSAFEKARSISTRASESAILAGRTIWSCQACIHLIGALHVRALAICLASCRR